MKMKMLRKDEPICATRARHGIVVHHGLAALWIDWTLAPAPTQFSGMLFHSRPDSSAPPPSPRITVTSHLLDGISLDWDGMRVRMNF
jgi:hypothetical protein